MANENTQTIDDQEEQTPIETETEEITASPSATDGETTPPSGEEAAPEPTLESVQAELAASNVKLVDAEKANTGLLTAVRSERSQRQELQGREQQINDVLSNVLARREQAGAEGEETAAPSVDNIPVQIDEATGDAFVKPGFFNKMIEKQGEASANRIQALEDQIADERAVADQNAVTDRLVSSVVSEDASYAAGYNKVQNAYDWINNEVINYQNTNRIRGKMSPGQAIDIISDTEIEAEFTKAFPGLTVEKTIRMHDSKRDLRNAIKGVLAEPTKATVKIDPEATKKLLKKASNLSEVQNQAQVQAGLTAETLSGMKPEEFAKIAATPQDLKKIWNIVERDLDKA